MGMLLSRRRKETDKKEINITKKDNIINNNVGFKHNEVDKKETIQNNFNNKPKFKN